MGGRQHRELAYAVAQAVGLRDATNIAEASALPDSSPGFPGTHHTPHNARYVVAWLQEARRYELSNRTRDRDYHLGYALHFFADSFSPYTGREGERDLHNAFERWCGKLVRRDAFRHLEVPAVPPKSTAAWVRDQISKPYPQLPDPSRDYVRKWSDELYKMCVCAARAVVEVHADPEEERRASIIYATAKSDLAGVAEMRRNLSQRRNALRGEINTRERQVPRMLRGLTLKVGIAVAWALLPAAWLGPSAALMWSSLGSGTLGPFILGLLWLAAPPIVDILTDGAERPDALLGALPAPKPWWQSRKALLPVRRELQDVESTIAGSALEASMITGRYKREMAGVRSEWYTPPADRSRELHL